PGAGGVVTAPARIVRGPADFAAVRRGDIVICPFTDPAWMPLFSIAAGVVTETGGALSHAAIVAREYGIPAVLGVVDATTRIEDGSRVTLDGGAGTVSVLRPTSDPPDERLHPILGKVSLRESALDTIHRCSLATKPPGVRSGRIGAGSARRQSSRSLTGELLGNAAWLSAEQSGERGVGL